MPTETPATGPRTDAPTVPGTAPAPGREHAPGVPPPPGSDASRVADDILSTEPLLTGDEAGYYLRALTEARRWIVAAVVGVTALFVVLAFVLPEEFTAHVVMLPTDDGEQGFPSQLSGIASSIGLQFPFGSVSQSDLYPTILTSDRLLSELLQDRFAPRQGSAPVPLADWALDRDDLTDHEHRMGALEELRENVVRAHKDTDTGVVTLSVSTDDPALSAAVANRLVSRLEDYLIETRQIEGQRNRTFLDDRVAVVSEDLRKAEGQLTRFRETNRRVQDSPELLLAQERLTRDVLMQEQIFLELQRQKEVAKIEEVKNTPVLRILDAATPPVRASRPKKKIVVTMGFVLGLLAALGTVLVRAWLRLTPEAADALRPFGSDLHALRALIRRGHRKPGGRPA